jgi:hypothetical protein
MPTLGLAQPVFSFLEREGKLGARDAGGHSGTFGYIYNAETTVVQTLADFLKSIALGLSCSANALFLGVGHEAPSCSGKRLYTINELQTARRRANTCAVAAKLVNRIK